MDYPKLRGSIDGLRYPVYVEPKIDGELAWLRADGGYLESKSGRKREGIPATEVFTQYDLLGELHWGDGKKGALYELLKNQKSDDLRFTVFDICVPGTYIDRRERLNNTITPTPHVQIIPVTIVKNKNEAMEAYRKYLDEGYEGAVFKSFDTNLVMGSCSWVKMKEMQSRDVIVTYIDPSRERIEVMAGNSKITGVKVPTIEKTKLKVGDIIEVEHLGELESGALRNPVYKPKERNDKSTSAIGATG